MSEFFSGISPSYFLYFLMKRSLFARSFLPLQNRTKLWTKSQYNLYSTSSLTLWPEQNISDLKNQVEFLFTPDLLQHINQRLQQISRYQISAPRRAAVFGISLNLFLLRHLTDFFSERSVPFCNVGGRGSLLFTKRSEKLATHAGQGSLFMSTGVRDSCLRVCVCSILSWWIDSTRRQR